MPLSGDELAADLANLWQAGQYLIPRVAADLRAADRACPDQVSSVCRRPGDIGTGDTGPGDLLDLLLGQLHRALGGTADTLDRVGANLVTLALDYEDTDAECAAEFRRKQGVISADYPGGPGSASTTTAA